jgi:hypothetical protein
MRNEDAVTDETTEERLRREYEQILCKPPATQDFTSSDQWRERVDAAYAALRAEIQRPLREALVDAVRVIGYAKDNLESLGEFPDGKPWWWDEDVAAIERLGGAS